jgi:hypothetical protein
MSAKVAILYPSAAMALLTLSLLLSLGLRRFIAVRRGLVNVKYYRTFAEGSEPEAMRRHTRQVQNHFEVPPLFHLALFGTYMVGEVTTATLAAAWFFVASRCVHTFVHLGYNNVQHRFMVFGAGAAAVAFLWVRLALSIA